MPQNRETGAEASQYGREFGGKVIAALGGTRTKAGSNEFLLDGERLTIHCARRRTTKVGVTYRVLETCDAVLGAFEQDDGTYHVLRLSAEQYRNHMEPTRSRGPSAGRVGLVTRAVFLQLGSLVKVLRL
jgi:hypothetical protein